MNLYPSFVFPPPSLAHNVEIADDVAATLHIEPNDQPKAGEPALTWFALTRQGGQLISLAQCDCQLAVYAEPRPASADPFAQPPLAAVNAERYQGIPGATITFPRPGRYSLELSGKPKAGASFKPFELRYEVTVARAANPNPAETRFSTESISETPKPLATESVNSGLGIAPWLGLFVVLLGGAIALALVFLRKKS